jgi:hypothetical protein
MSQETSLPTPILGKFASRNLTTPLGPVARYNLHNTLILTSVPFLCGVVMIMLLNVFAKLNLYFLESNGLIILDEIRDAYYSQVQTEAMGVAGFLIAQIGVTAIVSIIVMRWASAPFTNAAITLRTAIDNPEALRPANRWLSENPFFDRVIWLFALRVKNGGDNQVKTPEVSLTPNLFFLVKFWLTFAVLSVVTGYFMGFVIGTVYEKIIGLGLTLVKTTNLSSSQHFFAAQQEILQDATKITMILSLLIYFVLGLRISRYISTMMYVFTRAVEDDRFPVRLRSPDIFHGLADAMNEARAKIK